MSEIPELTKTMRLPISLLVLAMIHLGGSASAVTKFYDSTGNNGLPGDRILYSSDRCPPIQTTEGSEEGWAVLEDDEAGSVSLDLKLTGRTIADLTQGELIPVFGPGAFIFIDDNTTNTNVPPGGSVHAGLAGSGTDPGEAAVWGIVSGWSLTGSSFCVSSPISICNNAGFAHGQTISRTLTSGTFNLGTWSFDAEGDDQASPYITVTSNGGLTNNQALLRGAFTGSALPALPLVGAGALALSLAVIGGRSLMGRK